LFPVPPGENRGVLFRRISCVYPTLHCNCTALHCTALHCTALHCTALHRTALHCIELHSTRSPTIRCHPISQPVPFCSADRPVPCTLYSVQCTVYTAQCSAVQCNLHTCSAVQCSATCTLAVQCSAVQCSAPCTLSQCSAVQSPPAPHTAMPRVGVEQAVALIVIPYMVPMPSDMWHPVNTSPPVHVYSGSLRSCSSVVVAGIAHLQGSTAGAVLTQCLKTKKEVTGCVCLSSPGIPSTWTIDISHRFTRPCSLLPICTYSHGKG
jgi:hypothetical protein